MADVTGTYMDRSLHDFQQACEDCIDTEQEKPIPDTELIALLSDAIRLAREMTVLANRGLTPAQDALH